jgi:hypothetical protein
MAEIEPNDGPESPLLPTRAVCHCLLIETPSSGLVLVESGISSTAIERHREALGNEFPGLAGVVKTLAGELGPAGIRINGLLPVRIATDRVRALDALRGDPDEERARQSARIPLRRYGEPEEFG